MAYTPLPPRLKRKAYLFSGIYTDLGKQTRLRLAQVYRLVKSASGLMSRMVIDDWFRYSEKAAQLLGRTAAEGYENITEFELMGVIVAGILWTLLLLACGIAMATVSIMFLVLIIGVFLWVIGLSTLFALLVLLTAGVVTAGSATTSVALLAVAESLQFGEWALLACRGVFLTCPWCQTRFRWPIYLCPDCGTADRHLRPGTYGVLHNACAECGRKLPALLFNGRHKLRQLCHGCEKPLLLHIDAREWHLAVVGSRGSGKTSSIIAGLMELERKVLPAAGFVMAIEDLGQKASYQRCCGMLERGQPLDKTHNHRPVAFQVTIRDRHREKRGTIYVYDAAGEVFEQETALEISHTGRYLYVNAIILIVDPFAEEFNRARFALSPEEKRGLSPGGIPSKEVLDRLIEFLETQLQVAPQRKTGIALAVQVTKGDGFGILEECGGAVDLTGASSLAQSAKLAGERSGQVREALRSWQMDDFIRALESRFDPLCYFVSSPLGSMPGAMHAPFGSKCAANPYLWLLVHSGLLSERPKKTAVARNLGRFFFRCLGGREGQRLQLVVGGVSAVFVLAVLWLVLKLFSHL